MHFRSSLLLLATFAAGLPSASRACSICGCSLSSDWALEGFRETPGTLFSLRYEYFDQDQLRSGSGSVDRHALALPNDGEIQLDTSNRNVFLQFDDAIDPTWAVSIQLPYHDRVHRTIAAGDTEASSSQARGFGDARLLVRRQLRKTLQENLVVQFGLKLPTGRFDQNFADGPQAGRLLDRGLQLGTGTTDLLAGAAWFGRPAARWGVFAEALYQQPLAERAGFAPAASLTVNGGVRWLNASNFTPQLQVNVRHEGRERGRESDRPNSGGTIALLSPGLTVQFSPKVSAYAFMQLPVFQRWNGLQLQPRALFIAGLSSRW